MPFFVNAEIVSESSFHRYGQAVELKLNKALVEAAELTLQSVRAHETRVGVPREDGELPGVHVPEGVHLRDSFKWEVVKRPYFGFLGAVSSALIVVYSMNPNAIWQELGTRGRRRTALKQGVNKQGNPHRHSGGRGVTGLHFMRDGLLAAEPEVARLIADAVAEAGATLGTSLGSIEAGGGAINPTKFGGRHLFPLKGGFGGG